MQFKFLRISIIFTLLFFAINLWGQNTTSLFTLAKQYFEQGSYSASIQNLKSLEYQIGSNPKIQSLLIYSYVALKDYINAKIELEKFKKLIGNKRTESMQAILNLEPEINSGVYNEDQNYRQTILSKRMSEAINIVDREISANNIKREALNSQFNFLKEQITKNASPNDIASSLRTLSNSKKIELQINLRKDKKIKRRWEVQYSDKSLTHIAKLLYYEYNVYGDLIKYLAKVYGSGRDGYIDSFDDYPQFVDSMVSTSYIENLIKTNDYNTFLLCNVSPMVKTKSNILFSKMEKTLYTRRNKEVIPSNETKFTWRDINNSIVADSTITGYRTFVNIYDPLSFKIIVSRTYQRGIKSNETRFEYGQSGNKETQNVTSVSNENNKSTTERYSTQHEYNEMGDMSTFKNGLGHFESNIYKYDIYGNIAYLDKYNLDYDITYSYFYHFYEYQDRFSTKIDDFKSLQAMNKIQPKITAAELNANFEKALQNKKRGFNREFKRLMEICLNNDSTNILYLYWMASIYFEANYTDKALSFIQKIHTIDASFVPVYELKAKHYSSKYNSELAILNYKIAADWGMTSAVKTLANFYKLKYKPDEKLLSRDNNVDGIDFKDGLYVNNGLTSSFVEIVKGKKEIFYRFAKRSTDDKITFTSERVVYERSKKNPNVYFWKPNPQYRIIISTSKIYFFGPDGWDLYSINRGY